MNDAQPSPRHALITGANTGIGLTTALGLARQRIHLTLACRDMEKAARARDEIVAKVPHAEGHVELIQLDLSDLTQVRTAAAAWLEKDAPLDLLINNAGLAGARGVTRDGFELAFGVNHLGHFLWTLSLLPALEKRPHPRIVNVASRAHYRAPGIDFDAVQRPTRSTTGFPEYQVSKLANVLFSAELDRRLSARDTDSPNISCYSLHPGVVATDVWRKVPAPLRAVMKWFMISSEDGAKTTLYCATDPACAAESGGYYDECAPKEPSALAQDAALAATLWARSSEWTEIDL